MKLRATDSKAKLKHLMALSLALAIGGNSVGLSALAAVGGEGPSNTILLPLTPKIDNTELTEDEQSLPSPVSKGGSASSKSNASGSSASAKKASASPAAQSAQSTTQQYNYSQTANSARPAATGDDTTGDAAPLMLESREPVTDDLPVASDRLKAETPNASNVLEAEASEDDLKVSEMNEQINEDDTLKGVIQIVADDTEYDQEKNTFLGTGNAVAIIGGQKSKLEADTILYDQTNEMIDARGHVKILRDGQLTSGTAFKFKVSSDEYLITSPDTNLKGTQVIARMAYGAHNSLLFKNGEMTLAKPFHIGKNVMFGPIGAGQDVIDRVLHPDAFVEDKPSFKFKARKMVYETYKDEGNVTIFGGRLDFGNFSLPLPKFVATTGKENHVTFPITPMFTSNIQSGGHNVGPAFNYAIGRTGQFSWAPMIQFGGQQTTGTSTGSNIGLSGQVGFSNDKFSTHFAYGSVSQLAVGDFKMPIRKIGNLNTRGLKLQVGLNRFLTEGLFGYRRANLLAELVDDHPLKKQVPFISGVNFRTSAGAMRDQASLITPNPDLVKLYGGLLQSTKSQPSAFRIEEQITASTVNLFAVGDDRYGVKSYMFGGVAAGAYSTGNYRGLVQYGPQLAVKLNRFALNAGYVQAAVRGTSPFYFDQYLQGSRSINISGDLKIAKWLRVGGGYGYNLDAKAAYAKTINVALGPDDFKILLNRDVLNKVNRFGFDILYGQAVPFQRLALKARPDAGQLSSY